MSTRKTQNDTNARTRIKLLHNHTDQMPDWKEEMSPTGIPVTWFSLTFCLLLSTQSAIRC